MSVTIRDLERELAQKIAHADRELRGNTLMWRGAVVLELSQREVYRLEVKCRKAAKQAALLVDEFPRQAAQLKKTIDEIRPDLPYRAFEAEIEQELQP